MAGGDSSSADRWYALVLRVPREAAEALAAELGALGRGVESKAVDHRDEELRAFLRAPEQAGELRAWAERRLEAAGLACDRCGFRVEQVEDGRWVERYQASLRPFPFASRYTVHPRGRVEVEDGRKPLLLVPGRAFGTGEHATTQLCAEQLERRVNAGDAWLDLGCGSGILLLVAADHGAARAHGIELDPDAAAVAAEVLAQNGAPAGATVATGGLEDAERDVWDGAICNISSTFARMHAVDLARLPRPGGLLLLSGILSEDVADVAARCSAAGLRELERVSRGPWAALVLERER